MHFSMAFWPPEFLMKYLFLFCSILHYAWILSMQLSMFIVCPFICLKIVERRVLTCLTGALSVSCNIPFLRSGQVLFSLHGIYIYFFYLEHGYPIFDPVTWGHLPACWVSCIAILLQMCSMGYRIHIPDLEY